MLKTIEIVRRQRDAHNFYERYGTYNLVGKEMGITYQRAAQLKRAYAELVQRVDYVYRKFPNLDNAEICQALELTDDALDMVLGSLDLIHTYGRIEESALLDSKVTRLDKRRAKLEKRREFERMAREKSERLNAALMGTI